jgi:hypothetical protein
MALNKTLKRLVVTGLARIRSGVKARFGDRGGDEISVRLDTSRTPSELVFYDENNDADALRLPIGSDIATELENGGRHEMNVGGLSGDLADRQNPKKHSSRHVNGGADEIEVVDLDATGGSEGEAVAVNSNGELIYDTVAGKSDNEVQKLAVKEDIVDIT